MKPGVIQEWVWPGVVHDPGATRPVYPYSKLQNIERLADVRSAVLEETKHFEADFGRDAVTPLYDLIWTLNGCSGLATSHAVAGYDGRLQQHPAYMWAEKSVGAKITLVLRDASLWRDVRFAASATDELIRAIRDGRQPGNSTGWCLGSYPIATSFEEYVGYSVELELFGFAGNKRSASRRWSALCGFVSESIRTGQYLDGNVPAPPHVACLPRDSASSRHGIELSQFSRPERPKRHAGCSLTIE